MQLGSLGWREALSSSGRQGKLERALSRASSSSGHLGWEEEKQLLQRCYGNLYHLNYLSSDRSKISYGSQTKT